MVKMSNSPRSCAMPWCLWLDFPVPFLRCCGTRTFAFARRGLAWAKRDPLPKSGVTGHGQMLLACLSFQEQIHFSHRLLFQRFVGGGNELFEEVLHRLIQLRVAIATGAPLW